MRRIGVDFDNTIACYDEVFLKVANDLGYLLDEFCLTKSQVKKRILEINNGDVIWQKIQGQVYGKYMHQATIFPGLLEFLWLSKCRGDDVCIVSHKSEYGHFDESKTNLRMAATAWINENLIKSTSGKVFGDISQIYFESTREEKVKRIDQIGCDFFIDDLQEIFDENNFPSRTEKILFDVNSQTKLTKIPKQFSSWRKIKKYIYDDDELADVKFIVQSNFEALNIESIELKKGRGNSRIYRLGDLCGKQYALKIYPDIQSDNRPRLATEYYVCAQLSKQNFSVPQAVDKSDGLNWAIYEWVDGKAVDTPDMDFLKQSFQFIKDLQSNNQIRDQFKDAPLASEACLSGEEIVSQIKGRLNRLANVKNANLDKFLNDKFLPILDSVIIEAKLKMGVTFSMALEKKYQVLNPSDFGAHNAVFDSQNKCHFFDFEYFGWDDPVKLASDFYWHPAMNLNSDLQIIWISLTNELFGNDSTYAKRLTAYLPLFGLRWCLILLNEFIPERLFSRAHADKEVECNFENILNMQLQKSTNLLKKIFEMVNHGSTIKTA